MQDYIIVMDKMNGPHLEHKKYKYISREWKNGRWVYTYPKVSSGNYVKAKQTSMDASYNLQAASMKQKYYASENQRLNNYKKEVQGMQNNASSEQAKRLYDEALKDVDSAIAINKDNMRTQAQTVKDYGKAYSSRSKTATAEYNRYVKENAEWEHKMHKEIKKWESSPISKIETAIHKGIDKVKSILSKLKKK